MLKRIALFGALSLGLFLSGCGHKSSDNSNPPPLPSPPPVTNPVPVLSTLDACAAVHNYLEVVRYKSTDGATVGYAIEIENFCTYTANNQPNVSGLIQGPDNAKYFQDLMQDAVNYNNGGPPVIPDVKNF